MRPLPEHVHTAPLRAVRLCTRCVMDSGTPGVTFDDQGICSYCRHYEEYGRFSEKTLQQHTPEARDKLLDTIRAGRVGDYDCIIGLSGGADSTYVAYLAVKNGLKPLAVHLDNGWNAELAVKNVESTVKHLKLDLITHVIDWEEFRDIQLSFFRAGVIDLEMPTDHAIGMILYDLANKFDLPYFLSGTNLATEAMMPQSWFFDNKLDPWNFRDIYQRFGSGRPIPTFPLFRLDQYVRRRYFSRIKVLSFLNYFDYDKPKAVELLGREIGYVPYPIKHYESVFTRFYQGYILPVKFGVDKRKPFLSTMVMTGQITRDYALAELAKPNYDPQQLRQDRRFVLKKLGFTEESFDAYMKAPIVDHLAYRSVTAVEQKLRRIKRGAKTLLGAG